MEDTGEHYVTSENSFVRLSAWSSYFAYWQSSVSPRSSTTVLGGGMEISAKHMEELKAFCHRKAIEVRYTEEWFLARMEDGERYDIEVTIDDMGVYSWWAYSPYTDNEGGEPLAQIVLGEQHG
jgi:hypothetical protein